jgi:hypothetical protein
MSVLEHRYYQKSLGDFSGKDNAGTYVSADTEFVQNSGIWCLEFGGTTSEVDCGSDSSLDMTGDYTVGILVASDNIIANSFIFGRYNDGASRGFGIRFNATGTITYFHTTRGSTEGGLLGNSISSTTVYDDGEFHWIYAGFSVGMGSVLYVDDIFVGSDSTRTEAISAFTQTCYVGRQHGASPRRMFGRVAEVVVWPRLLDDVEMSRERAKYRNKLSRRGRPPVSYYLPFNGQSLSTGVKGQPAISTSPDQGLTFVNGPRSDTDELTYLKSLIENDVTGPDGNTESGETACFSAVNRAHDMGGYDLVSSTVGHAGYSITQLNKGTGWYDYLTAHIQEASRLQQARGRPLSVPAMAWIQGETDRTMAEATYKGHMEKLQKDVQADARLLTGQTDAVPIIMYQMAYYSRLTPNVTNVQYELDRDDANFMIATPMYHFPYDDGAHLTNVGYKWMGHYFGKALDYVIRGQTWKPLRPTSVTLNGKIFTVTFDVPNTPLTLDTTNVGAATGSGFRPRDDTRFLTVTRVEVTTSTQVEVEVSETVGANPRVRYGRDWLGSGMTITGGASGNLRDSCPDYFVYSSQTYNLYNWCVHFEEYV